MVTINDGIIAISKILLLLVGPFGSPSFILDEISLFGFLSLIIIATIIPPTPLCFYNIGEFQVPWTFSHVSRANSPYSPMCAIYLKTPKVNYMWYIHSQSVSNA